MLCGGWVRCTLLGPSYLLLTSDSLAAGWNSGLISHELLCSNYLSKRSEMHLNNCPLRWLPISFYISLFLTEIRCPSTVHSGSYFPFRHSSCLLRPFAIQTSRYVYICNPYLVDEVVGSLQFQSSWSSLQCLSGAIAGVKTT